jgi:ATP-dependent RNA helicase DDX54/DBP10
MRSDKKKSSKGSKFHTKRKFSNGAQPAKAAANSGDPGRADDNDENEEQFSGKGFASQMQEMNRKNKKSGGFQSMGLGPEIFRGIIKKGYKVPTPIQRKTIPVILEGRDVVGMARTGSGKTAAFLIPLFQKLMYSAARGIGAGASDKGARALVLSPTRELALQVFFIILYNI